MAGMIDKLFLDGVIPEKLAAWQGLIDELEGMAPGLDRQGAELKVDGIKRVITSLALGRSSYDAVRSLDPRTDLVIAAEIARDVAALAVRGEEFRLWWNEWHGRSHPDDLDPERRGQSQREVFNPGLIRYNGKPIQLMASFNPDLPVTRRSDYSKVVSDAIRNVKS